MLAAFILSMPERPDVETLTDYYAEAMMTPAMKWFCRKSGKSKFTDKDVAGLQKTAQLRAGDRNPFSWNMDFCPYPDDSGYEARFTPVSYTHLRQSMAMAWSGSTPKP